jgi:hypothetical protein
MAYPWQPERGADSHVVPWRVILVALVLVGCASSAAPRPPLSIGTSSTGLPRRGQPIESAGPSLVATFTCEGSPCPWGPSLTGHAIVWPTAAPPASRRLGYTVSPWIYLPAAVANGMTIVLETGTATAYAGTLDSVDHRKLATLDPGHPYVVAGLAPEEVLSVQAPSAFSYVLRGSREAPSGEPGSPSVPGETHRAIVAHWRCDVPECKGGDWHGAVINWPAWAAYQNNRRSGDKSRSVFSSTGEALHPYMGLWADGCEVTAVSGLVLIIEWERGTDTWRGTRLQPGQKHVIHLTPPENGAMIETEDNGPAFTVSLKNCAPKPVPR